MKKGFLSSYFEKIVIKRLTTVEVDKSKSNQHEINGVKELISMFGKTGQQKTKINTNFIYVTDNESDFESATDIATRYDARANNPHRTEHRLYYPENRVTQKLGEGDTLIIAKQTNGDTLFLVAANGTNIESQVLWLFSADDISTEFQLKIVSNQDRRVNFATRFILDELGINIKDTDDSLLEVLIERFGDGEFPTTKVFSEFARKHIGNSLNTNDPDKVIIAWMDHEELLFKTFERYLITKKFKEKKNTIINPQTDSVNIDEFFKFSLSFQNSRKSRVGQSLEHHLEEIFRQHNINYSRGCVTEGRSKPDFIFPNIDLYHNNDFDPNHLTMLGSKSTCKDRWRQVLSEAKKINQKHLFTLEPSISENQTQEMQANLLQLVIPEELFATYKPQQQEWLMSLKDFIKLVQERELCSSI